MRDYFKMWFKPGPRSLKVAVIDCLFWSAVFVGAGLLFDWGTSLIVIVVVVFNASVAGRYVWWHFRPYKEPPPQPVTRYTKNYPTR